MASEFFGRFRRRGSTGAAQAAPPPAGDVVRAPSTADAGGAPHFPIPVREGYVRANDLDIWYAEAGEGVPLLLLHGATVSNGPIWADHQYGWGSQMGSFAQRFRVIAPDTRGHGRTRNPGGIQSFQANAEDVLALVEALHLERPVLCGFSDGGITATIVAILDPAMPRAVVNLAGYDAFYPDPDDPRRVKMREFLGGSPTATRNDVAAHYARMVQEHPESPLRQKRIADYEPTQGQDYLVTYFENCFDMWTTPIPFTLDDFPRIAAPTAILVGDRDEFCSVEEGVSAYRRLPQGELGIAPGMEHGISPLVTTLALDFLSRHSM